MRTKTRVVWWSDVDISLTQVERQVWDWELPNIGLVCPESYRLLIGERPILKAAGSRWKIKSVIRQVGQDGGHQLDESVFSGLVEGDDIEGFEGVIPRQIFSSSCLFIAYLLFVAFRDTLFFSISVPPLGVDFNPFSRFVHPTIWIFDLNSRNIYTKIKHPGR